MYNSKFCFFELTFDNYSLLNWHIMYKKIKSLNTDLIRVTRYWSKILKINFRNMQNKISSMYYKYLTTLKCIYILIFIYFCKYHSTMVCYNRNQYANAISLKRPSSDNNNRQRYLQSRRISIMSYGMRIL